MNEIPFLLDERTYRMGIEKWVPIDYKKSPHILWAGRTGSGKTVAAKLLLARTILLAPPEETVELTILDPKMDIDFSFLNGLPRFFKGEDATKGFDLFFEKYLARKEGRDLSKNLKILFCDEFGSLVSLEDKKEREVTQRKLSHLLMLSRSRHFSVQLATQQPNAQSMGNSGNREQFGAVCLLGDSGSETKTMLFDGDSREIMKSFGSIGGRGVGWLSLNGGIAQPVRVPIVGDMEKLNRIIYNNLAE